MAQESSCASNQRIGFISIKKPVLLTPAFLFIKEKQDVRTGFLHLSEYSFLLVGSNS